MAPYTGNKSRISPKLSATYTDPVGCPYQIFSIKNLHLPDGIASGIGQIAVVAAERQGAQSAQVRRRIADGVHHFHVSDIMDIQALFQADYEALLGPIKGKISY